MASLDKGFELTSLLQENASIQVSEIVRRLFVSRTAAQYRLNKLESLDVNKGYSVLLFKRNKQKNINNCGRIMIKTQIHMTYQLKYKRSLSMSWITLLI
jgi:DNA-binding Lrp family transcriptional regulator